MRVKYKQCAHEYRWDPAVNEEGWVCIYCDHKPGEPPGFDPARDRDDIERKCDDILHHLHMQGWFGSMSSATGEGMVCHAVDRCRETGCYDQHSIVAFLVGGHEGSHAAYWRRIAEGVLSGNDKRERCPCGALATSYSSKGGGKWTHRCSAHWQIGDDAEVPRG